MSEKNNQLFAYLQLALSENVGPVTFRQLLAFFKTPQEALKQLPEMANRGGKKKIQICPEKMVEAQLNRMREIGGNILTYQDLDYPNLLKQITDAPPFLFTLGHTILLNKRCVALVGTRHASINGQNMTKILSHDLIEHGFCVVSGMAHGIDRSAHIGALESSPSEVGTVAVLGSPVDEIYPKENADIYDQIKERGCLVSEFAFGTQIAPTNFPRRNRIISGLSEGVVIIEAQVRSGSLITAREALSQGREVMAVPGFPLEPRSAGPNALIKDGACLIEKTEDILENLNQNRQFHLAQVIPEENTLPDFCTLDHEVNSLRQNVINALSAEPVEIGLLARSTQIDLSVINIVLVELELAGRLERHHGNKVSLIYGG